MTVVLILSIAAVSIIAIMYLLPLLCISILTVYHLHFLMYILLHNTVSRYGTNRTMAWDVAAGNDMLFCGQRK